MGLETLILLTITGVFGMYMAWNIGANDVANAMGTSVGSGALTLRNAVIVAALLEFSGAFFVGGHVTETVRKGMLDLSLFPEPKILLLGMLGALLASGIWLHLATWKGWPVSTTHSIVGAIVGFGAAAAGIKAIQWGKITTIVSSWIISPMMSGVIAFCIFMFIRHFILENEKPLSALRIIAPILVFAVFNVIFLVTTFKGLKNLHLDLSFEMASLISISVSIALALLSWLLIGHQVKKAEEMSRLELRKETKELDLRGTIRHDFRVIEKVFVSLQILSACAVAFAHGANDVANTVGPVATVWEIARTGVVAAQVMVHPALLALGGIGIVVGLATWGWRIIETVGSKITDLTPTRGFSAEFGAACTILIGSRMGLPLSTTHCLVGAVIGVGMARGMTSINLGMIRQILMSWVFTVPAAAIISIISFYGLLLIFGPTF